MGFVSILSKNQDESAQKSMSAFLYDLNLDQVIERIQALSSAPVKKYFYGMPREKEDEDYRRAIYADIKSEDICKILMEFSELIADRNELLTQKNDVRMELQYHVWHVLEVAAYCDSYVTLYEGISEKVLKSEGLKALREELTDYVLSRRFSDMKKIAWALREKLQNFHIKLVLEKDQIVVTEEQVAGTYENFIKQRLGQQDVVMRPPFSKSVALCEFEQEIVHKLEWRRLEFFDEVTDFYKKYKEYIHPILLRFADEVQYYLSYYRFQKKMELEGFSFVAPTVDESKDMSACGLYDLALACESLSSGKKIVSNDMLYCNGESFLIVTGPNQGGKTTYARSLGQLVYLCKMGLDVPATVANIHYFTNILTHFSVEESVETGRGKLMDELVRLKPMMHTESGKAFVIINELFTTAANYDACIMGKKVLLRFIEQGCRGIYVTHLRELTEAHESVVSMCAMLDQRQIQNFQIMRKAPVESACAVNQVKKYGLSYEKVKERLS